MALLAVLLVAWSGDSISSMPDPWASALQTMHFMIGTWHCSAREVGGHEYDYSMTTSPTLGKLWLRADVAFPQVGDERAWSEVFYWTYVPLTKDWVLHSFDSGGNEGNFGATWWDGSSITWRGYRIIMGHHDDRAIRWTKISDSHIAWNEYDSDAAWHLKLMSAATCARRH